GGGGGGVGSAAAVAGPSSVGASRWQPASTPSDETRSAAESELKTRTLLRPSPRLRGATSADDMQAQPFREERGLVFIFDLDRHVDLHHEVARLALADLRECAVCTHALTDAHRCDEADLVEPVVHEQRSACGLRDEVDAERHEQRQREKAVRDRAAERRLLRAHGIDVNELMVERDVRETVHALLIDQEPVGHAESLANHAVELLARDGSCHGRSLVNCAGSGPQSPTLPARRGRIVATAQAGVKLEAARDTAPPMSKLH